jgi:hypothetical protein
MRDISPAGFYCIVDQPIQPGEQLECDIAVPVHNLPSPNDVVYLHCRIQVIRVEQIPSGEGFGLGCRIDEYRIIHGSIECPEILQALGKEF